MTTYDVAITDRALSELDAACTWWEDNRSVEQATKWYNGFIKAIKRLSSNPEQHALAAENELFPYELRQLNYGVSLRPTHRAVFTVRPEMVLVLRIRHLAQAPISPE